MIVSLVITLAIQVLASMAVLTVPVLAPEAAVTNGVSAALVGGRATACGSAAKGMSVRGGYPGWNNEHSPQCSRWNSCLTLTRRRYALPRRVH